MFDHHGDGVPEFGEVDDGVLTVRFTYRTSIIRIIGAGYWRKRKGICERENE